MKKKIFLSLLLLVIPFTVLASNDELWLDRPTVKELENIYHKNDYDNHIPLPSYTIPAIFLRHFPSDFNQITNEDQRAQLFIKILSPLALKINQKILQERLSVEMISAKINQNQSLSENDIKQLEKLASKYDVFTRLKGNQRHKLLAGELTDKVDIVPASILIVASAIETNWGASRVIKEGNALYKEKIWYSDEGIIPLGESDDQDYKIKIYPDLYSAMDEFALKINSSVTYQNTRDVRKQSRFREKPILGTTLAHSFIHHSPLNNYSGLLDYTIAYYELSIVDKSTLRTGITLKKN